jgi:hypothetical protein
MVQRAVVAAICSMRRLLVCQDRLVVLHFDQSIPNRQKPVMIAAIIIIHNIIINNSINTIFVVAVSSTTHGMIPIIVATTTQQLVTTLEHHPTTLPTTAAAMLIQEKIPHVMVTISTTTRNNTYRPAPTVVVVVVEVQVWSWVDPHPFISPNQPVVRMIEGLPIEVQRPCFVVDLLPRAAVRNRTTTTTMTIARKRFSCP